MEEGKITGGLSLSFLSGIAAGSLLATALPGPAAHPMTACTAAVLAAGGLLVLHRAGQRGTGLPPLLALFALTGLFCALSDALPGGAELRWELPQSCAERLRGLIATLPFAHDGTGALVSALTTGDRSGLDAATVRVFRDSGASHLLALSGLHVGVLYLTAGRLLFWTGRSPRGRRFRSLLLVALAGFYTVATGASPSIVRAFLYIAIHEFCRLTQRSCQPGKVLCLALTVQLVLSPASIRSTGFQLSYLAMAGIYLVYPRLKAWWPGDGKGRFHPLRGIWNAAALAISCQLFTGPLAWWRFGSFPTHFLITNLLAIPLTSALLILSLLTIVLSAAGLCPGILPTLTDALAQLLLSVLSTIASL